MLSYRTYRCNGSGYLHKKLCIYEICTSIKLSFLAKPATDMMISSIVILFQLLDLIFASPFPLQR